MSIVTLQDCLDFIDISAGYFEINAANDKLVMSYDAGSATNVDAADGTYSGTEAAAALETALDTAFSITSAVSYSTTTRKFTADAGSGHTFAYTHSGSDGGLTFGFNADHAAARTITSNLAAGDPTAIVEDIRISVEAEVQNFCNRTFESTAYILEKYDGTGTKNLYLKNYPITLLTRLSIGINDAIKIRNTSEYTSASVSVTSTGVVLTKDGTSENELTFAGYTTMTLIIAAINAIGSGWESEISNSDSASFASSELLIRWGASTIDSNYINLAIPAEGEDDFEVYENRGQIKKSVGVFGKGNKNVFITHTAGYSSTTMPEDLKRGIKIVIADQYRKMKEDAFGLKRYRVDGLSVDFEDMPGEAKRIFWLYKRMKV